MNNDVTLTLDTVDLVATGRMKGKPPLKKQSSRTTKSKLKSSESQTGSPENELAAIGGRDTSLFLFRALGKILYCKSKHHFGQYFVCPK